MTRAAGQLHGCLRLIPEATRRPSRPKIRAASVMNRAYFMKKSVPASSCIRLSGPGIIFESRIRTIKRTAVISARKEKTLITVRENSILFSVIKTRQIVILLHKRLDSSLKIK